MVWAKPKAKTAARGYDHKHQKLRKALLPQAYGTPCFLCGELMLKGQALELDHNPQRTAYRGMVHKKCNRRDGARRARAKQLYGTRPITAHRW
jgi:hypothetical protein